MIKDYLLWRIEIVDNTQIEPLQRADKAALRQWFPSRAETIVVELTLDTRN